MVARRMNRWRHGIGLAGLGLSLLAGGCVVQAKVPKDGPADATQSGDKAHAMLTRFCDDIGGRRNAGDSACSQRLGGGDRGGASGDRGTWSG